MVADNVHGRRRGREGEAEAPVAGCCCYSCEEARGELVGLGMNPEGLWERRQRLDPFGIERGVDLRGRGRGCWLDRGRRRLWLDRWDGWDREGRALLWLVGG